VLAVSGTVPATDGEPGGLGTGEAVVPELLANIARDLLDPAVGGPEVCEDARGGNRRV